MKNALLASATEGRWADFGRWWVRLLSADICIMPLSASFLHVEGGSLGVAEMDGMERERVLMGTKVIGGISAFEADRHCG